MVSEEFAIVSRMRTGKNAFGSVWWNVNVTLEVELSFPYTLFFKPSLVITKGTNSRVILSQFDQLPLKSPRTSGHRVKTTASFGLLGKR
jgi:hypothetical protein